MRWLARLLPSHAAKDVLYALESLGKSWLNEVPAFADILERARRHAKTNPAAVRERMVVEGEPAMKIALNLMINLCAADLRSGQNHIYRGRLSGEGIQKQSLFKSMQKMMVERGLATQEDVDVGAARLAEEIADAG